MQGSAPVKIIVGVLTSDKDLRDHSTHLLSDKLGEIDYVSQWYSFSSNIYSNEMGENLFRSFVSFKDLIPPEQLYKIKEMAIKVEEKFKVSNRRLVNLDPGYIDHFKIVLASNKFAAHRIAIAKGCYADLLMYYAKGKYNPLPWCYPDLSGGTHDKDMLEIRRIFKADRSI
ncbi:MAG: GTP-binding protein [Deltaproteobacteria bacterium CG11_big_fil_rev_8_21_14_0_20_49_13]|nr:MAG: GTP-binding protein [Deltaproteobacteria bacterium CG11_big_fil_rev_8_21_14_0_20_49_13]